MANHSSIPSWEIPWTEEPGGLQFMGLEESDTTERLHFHFSLSAIRVVSSAYLRLLTLLLAILIPACSSSSPAFSHDVLCIEVK